MNALELLETLETFDRGVLGKLTVRVVLDGSEYDSDGVPIAAVLYDGIVETLNISEESITLDGVLVCSS